MNTTSPTMLTVLERDREYLKKSIEKTTHVVIKEVLNKQLAEVEARLTALQPTPEH